MSAKDSTDSRSWRAGSRVVAVNLAQLKVIADNTRLKAAQSLGMTEVPVWWFAGRMRCRLCGGPVMLLGDLGNLRSAIFCAPAAPTPT